MADGSIAKPAPQHRSLLTGLRSWRLWSMPGQALVLILGVEAVAAALLVTTLVLDLSRAGLRFGDLGRLVGLFGLSVVYSEVTYRMQRMRRYLGRAVLIGLHTVWAFAGALLLPWGYAAALATCLFVVGTFRRRQQKAVPYRLTYTGSTVVLATLAAKAVGSWVQPALSSLPSGPRTSAAIAAAALAFFLLNTVLVVAVIYLAGHPASLRALLPARQEFGLEVATLIVGVMTADMVLRLPCLSPCVLPLLYLLQRSSLVAQLEIAAATDAKTGLLNASAWQELSERELLRAKREQAPCAVLLMDLDHFKKVNDTVGHLAGDTALRAVGDALKRELRGYDAVARFGGEEFVVFLNDLAVDEATLVAERTLGRIRTLVIAGQPDSGQQVSLSASIGLAAYPQHGEELTELLEAADAALYEAKKAGRDQVALPGTAQIARPA